MIHLAATEISPGRPYVPRHGGCKAPDDSRRCAGLQFDAFQAGTAQN